MKIGNRQVIEESADVPGGAEAFLDCLATQIATMMYRDMAEKGGADRGKDGEDAPGDRCRAPRRHDHPHCAHRASADHKV